MFSFKILNDFNVKFINFAVNIQLEIKQTIVNARNNFKNNRRFSIIS